jgi:cytidine deaminase
VSATIDWDALARTAWRAREEAYAPYSQYRVGAALLAEDGRVFAGANVENASYGLCLCAERSAVGAAITAGVRRFAAIVVVTGGERPGSPCGMCRQVMSEFAPSFPVRCIAESGAMLESTTEALLPFAFTPASLGVEIEGMRSTLLLGSSNERSDTDRPPADPSATTAFVGVALKVAAGTGSELASAQVAQDADDERGPQ